jgi:hypothetical protein
MRLVGWSCRRGRGRGSCGRVWLFSEGGSGSGPLFLVRDRSWIFWLDFFFFYDTHNAITTMFWRRSHERVHVFWERSGNSNFY